MQKAALAASVHTANLVARALKVDRRRLGMMAARRPIEKQRVALRPPSPASGVRLAQVVLTSPAPSPAKALVEIIDPAGWRLSVSCADAAGLVKAFVEGRR